MQTVLQIELRVWTQRAVNRYNRCSKNANPDITQIIKKFESPLWENCEHYRKVSDSEVYIVTALPACTQQAADEGRKQGTYHKTELWYRKPRFNILLILFLYTSYFSAHILKYIPEDRMKNLMVLMATTITSKTQQHRDIFNAQSLLWPRFFVRDFVFLALYAFVYIKCILSPWCYM